jgi:hypothetical protein
MVFKELLRVLTTYILVMKNQKNVGRISALLIAAYPKFFLIGILAL